jgi:hypothetical protein
MFLVLFMVLICRDFLGKGEKFGFCGGVGVHELG